MKKGITPIISIIILLLITIALAGVAYTFLMGQMFGRISGSFDIPTGGAYCSGGSIYVQVVNTGSATLTSVQPGTDFIIIHIDGLTPAQSKIMNITIGPGEGGLLINGYGCGTGGCGPGPHAIDISTQTAARHETVYCA